jgi:hypothetical protein
MEPLMNTLYCRPLAADTLTHTICKAVAGCQAAAVAR